MKVVFYSEQCDYSKKLLAYLDKHSIKSLFKLVNVDKVTAPKDIDIVPTIIDTELNQPLKGKKAFEYLLNIKYFNNPTNNIEFEKHIPANPNIPEDEKANKSKTFNLEINGQSQVQDGFNEVFNGVVRNIDDPILFNQQTRQPIKIEQDINDSINTNTNSNLDTSLETKHVFNYQNQTEKINNIQQSDKNDSLNFHENNLNNSVSKATQEMVNARQNQDKKLSVLMQMKRR